MILVRKICGFTQEITSYLFFIFATFSIKLPFLSKEILFLKIFDLHIKGLSYRSTKKQTNVA